MTKNESLRDLLTAFGQAYHKLLSEGSLHGPTVEATERAITELFRSRVEPSAEPVSAWLLECVPPIGDVLYYCAPGDWCSSPNHAHRFQTKEEADAMHVTMQNSSIMRVAEHQWG
jgi:hypothetical protein